MRQVALGRVANRSLGAAARANVATNALDNGADIAKVQEILGHANIQATRIYDHRKTRPESLRSSRARTKVLARLPAKSARAIRKWDIRFRDLPCPYGTVFPLATL